MNIPKVSIIVIIYNRIEYIKECLNSIKNQNIDKEVILTDDCSTDGTFEFLKQFVKTNKEFKLYQNKEHLGTVLNMYNGLKHATCEYAWFVDADDVIIENSLSKLCSRAKETNADVLEFSIHTDCNDKNFKSKLLKQNGFINKEDLLEQFKQRKISNTLCNKLISKKVYTQVLEKINPNIRLSNFSCIIFFMYHVLMHSQNIVTTDIVGYFYYSYRGITSTYSTAECLKQYVGFLDTKKELNRIYGKLDALETTLSYVKKQALEVYSQLSKEEKIKYLPELSKLLVC